MSTIDQYAGTCMVAGTLRGYRQFLYRPDKAELASPTYPFTWHSGVNEAICANKTYVNFRSEPKCLGCEREFLSRYTYTNGYLGKRGGGEIFYRMLCIHRPQRAFWVYENSEMSVPMSDSVVVIRADVRSVCDKPPGRNDRCGFYGTYNIAQLMDAPGISFASRYRHYSELIGVVEAFGRISLGTKGFRAEKMRVLALSPPPNTNLVSERTTRFGMPTIMKGDEPTPTPLTEVPGYRPGYRFMTLDEMLHEFPEDDVSGLIHENGWKHVGTTTDGGSVSARRLDAES